MIHFKIGDKSVSLGNLLRVQLPGHDYYSTGEIRIGTWIDGKPLYRQSYYASSLTLKEGLNTLTWKTPDVDTLVDSYGYFYQAVNNRWIPINGMYATVLADRGKTLILSTTGTGTITSPLNLVLEYTKTTDSPDLLGPVIDSGATDVYSTEETLIGYWADKKPLYRKVYFVTTPSDVSVPTGVCETDADLNVKNIFGTVSLTSGLTYPVNSYLRTNEYIAAFHDQTENKIYMHVSYGDYANMPAQIVTEYTKETDSPVESINSISDTILTSISEGLDI